MRLNGILKNRIVQNAGWLIGGRLINKLLAFLVSIITARYLGPDDYGLINYAAAYITFAASLCTLGTNAVIIKNFMDYPKEEGAALGTTLVLRALSSCLIAVMIVGVVSIVDRDEPLTIIVVMLSSISLLFHVFDSLKRWFQAKLQSKFAAVATVLSFISVSGYKVVLLVLGKNVKWFALATSVEYVTLAAVLLLFYKRQGGPKLSCSIKKAKQILSESGGFIVSDLMVSIYAFTDKFMLKQMMDQSAVGYYALAVTLSAVWTFVLEAIIDSVYPSIVKAHGKSGELFQKRNRQLYAIVLYTALFVSFLIALLAEPIVKQLYGEAYLPAVIPLQIVVWYTAFSYLGGARNAWVVCEHKQKYLKYLYCAAAVINVVLNWLLIPVWGASGAAVASLVTQIATAVILPAIIRPLRPNAKLMLDAALLKDLFPRRTT